MNTEELLKTLRQLEPLEEAGMRCFVSTGRIPDFFQVYFLMTPGGFCRPGSANRDKQARETYEHILNVFHNQKSGSELPEKLFLPEEVNVELEHLLRYVDIRPHCHDFFELVCVLEGDCLHTVEAQDFLLGPGDLTIVPPQLLHHLKAEPDCVCITIKVRSSTFSQAFSSLLQGQSLLSAYFSRNLYMPQSRSALTFHCGKDSFVREHLLYMYGQQIRNCAYSGNIIEGMTSVLFFHLLQNHQENLEFSRNITRHDQRIAGVLDYLSANYRTATLSDTAAAFYLNPSYLSASLHKATGRTFSQHLRAFRLDRAASLLTHTNMRLEEICEQIGYQDTTQFIRYFKEAYHCTPHVFRKENSSGQSRETTPPSYTATR